MQTERGLRVNKDSFHNPLYNMALDGLLLRHLKNLQLPVLRIYGWKYPALTLGSRQSITTVKALIGNLSVPFYVKRVSRGGCLYHCDEIMTCFIAHKNIVPNNGNGKTKTLEKLFSQAVEKTLHSIGITRQTSPKGASLSRQTQYNPFQKSPYDIYDSQHKPLAVFAQKTGRTRILIHASVLPLRLSEYAFLMNKETREIVQNFCTTLSQIMLELFMFSGIKYWNYSEKVAQKALNEAYSYSLK